MNLALRILGCIVITYTVTAVLGLLVASRGLKLSQGAEWMLFVCVSISAAIISWRLLFAAKRDS